MSGLYARCVNSDVQCNKALQRLSSPPQVGLEGNGVDPLAVLVKDISLARDSCIVVDLLAIDKADCAGPHRWEI